MTFVRYVVAAVVGLAAFTFAPTDRTEWVGGCWAWKHSNNPAGYSAQCSSGSAKFAGRATCFGVGGYRTDYGTWVWPGRRSDGACSSGYYVTKVGWTQ